MHTFAISVPQIMEIW